MGLSYLFSYQVTNQIEKQNIRKPFEAPVIKNVKINKIGPMND